METISSFRLLGLSLRNKTSNENGQSGIDCGNLWQKFKIENYFEKIPGKLSNDIYAVYHNYEGDHTMPFSYFIGCMVMADLNVTDGFDSLTIPGGKYQIFKANGEMPSCVARTWEHIWTSDIPRAYQTDFEIYGEKSTNWSNAEIDIFISVK